MISTGINTQSEGFIKLISERLSVIHEQVNSKEAMEQRYSHVKTFPKLIFETAEMCLKAGLVANTEDCLRNLSVLAEKDLKFIPPDLENSDSRPWLLEREKKINCIPDEDDYKSPFRFENYRDFYINGPAKICNMAADNHNYDIASSLARNYHHLFFTLAELPETHSWAKDWLMFIMVCNLEKLLASPEYRTDPQLLSNNRMVIELAKDFLRGNRWGTRFELAERVSNSYCDLILCEVKREARPIEIETAVIQITVTGLNAMDEEKNGLKIVELVINTLDSIASLTPSRYRGYSEKEGKKRLMEELKGRFEQLLSNGKLDNLDKTLADRIRNAIARHFPNG